MLRLVTTRVLTKFSAMDSATTRLNVVRRHLETSVQGNKPDIPNPRLSSSFVYTLDNPRLSTNQRQFYEENGFIVIKNLVPQNSLTKYDLRFKELANGQDKVPGLVVQKDVAFVDQPRNENTVYKLQDLYLDDTLFEYCKMDTILDFAECFTGPNIMAVHTMLINKPPDSGKKTSRHPLHQDLHYFPFRPPNKIVCAWTAMEKVTRKNGCLVAVPGTHKGELLAHDYPEWEGPINMAYHGARGFSADVERVYLEMEAGDTVFFHPLLIHGSGANRTKGYRKAISCHYASSECQYIDVSGTTQENIAQEVLELARKKFGVDVGDYRVVWQFRSRLVRGKKITL